MHKPDWCNKVKRWIQINLTEDVCVDDHLSYWRKEWKRAPYQGVLLNCIGTVRYCSCGEGYVQPAKNLGNQDIFQRFSEAAREDGLVVAARFDLQEASVQYTLEHPEWFQRDSQGNFRSNQELQIAKTCINSDYYDTIMPRIIKDVIERYHPVAVTDNSWRGNRKSDICYCENCKRNFYVWSGKELPEKADWKDPIYREWIKWSYSRRTRIWDIFSRAAEEAGDGNCLWSGMLHADPMDRISELSDFHDICQRAKYLFLDHQGRDMLNGMDMEQNSMNGSMLYLMCPRDVIITEMTSHYPRCSYPHWFRHSAPLRAETLTWEQEAIMGGLAPTVHYMGTHTFDSRRTEISNDLLRWHERNEAYLFAREELADVALIWSQENGDFNGRGDYYTTAGANAIQPWEGYRHALTKGRIPFLPVNAHDIHKHSTRVRTLVLPELAVMSENDINALIEHIDRGGNLVLTGRSTLLDEYGEPYASSTGGHRLMEKLGLKHTGERLGAPYENRRYMGKEGCSYLRKRSEDPILFKGFEDTEILPFGGALQVLVSDGTLQMQASFIPGVPLSPVEFSYIQEERPEIGAVFAGILSSGAKVVYLAADYDRCYARDELPDYARLLQNAVLWTLSDRPMVKVDGVGYINVKLYQQDCDNDIKRIIIHLNNLTGSNVKSGYLEEFVPVGPIEIVMNRKMPPDLSIFAAVANCGLKWQHKREDITIVLDKIVDHEMIVIEYKEEGT